MRWCYVQTTEYDLQAMFHSRSLVWNIHAYQASTNAHYKNCTHSWFTVCLWHIIHDQHLHVSPCHLTSYFYKFWTGRAILRKRIRLLCGPYLTHKLETCSSKLREPTIFTRGTCLMNSLPTLNRKSLHILTIQYYSFGKFISEWEQPVVLSSAQLRKELHILQFVTIQLITVLKQRGPYNVPNGTICIIFHWLLVEATFTLLDVDINMIS